MGVQQGDRDFDNVLSVCTAIRQAEKLLFLDDKYATELGQHLTTIDDLIAEGCLDRARAITTLKAIRYLLIESSSGPVAPFLIDSLATVIGDGHGKIFFKPSQ
ncbi:hypothetical protein AB0C29_00330 [Actinoplanes sp. NPDC048791]|uniref:hypothetical protein n=1 Tax=Actinoplanes sp. NPDC048791 TaxID=3154623 RepID=UPI0033C7186F